MNNALQQKITLYAFDQYGDPVEMVGVNKTRLHLLIEELIKISENNRHFKEQTHSFPLTVHYASKHQKK